jgi:hypothetical protein
MLQQAAELSAEHYGKQHPGVLRQTVALLVCWSVAAQWRSVHHRTARCLRCIVRIVVQPCSCKVHHSFTKLALKADECMLCVHFCRKTKSVWLWCGWSAAGILACCTPSHCAQTHTIRHWPSSC